MAFRTRSGKLYGTPDVKKCLVVSKSALTKSASKRLNLLDQNLPELEGNSLIDDTVLEEIFKLSPVSPIKRCKENIKPSVTNCRILLSPLRSLTLNSPRSKDVDVARNAFVKNRLNLALSGSTEPSTGQVVPPKSPKKLPFGDLSNVKTSVSPTKSDTFKDEKQTSPKRSIDANHRPQSPSPSKKQKFNKRNTENIKSPNRNEHLEMHTSPSKSPTKQNASPYKPAFRKTLVEIQNLDVKDTSTAIDKSPVKQGKRGKNI